MRKIVYTYYNIIRKKERILREINSLAFAKIFYRKERFYILKELILILASALVISQLPY